MAKRCRNCKKIFDPINSMQIACRLECAIAVSKTDTGKKHKEKAIKNDHKERKKKLNANKTRARAAKEACHEYIRARDKGKPCLCCGKPLGDDYQAGHFLESGNYPSIRFNEDNIHGQRLHCNMFKGGDSGDYEQNLRAKIGDLRVDFLKAEKNKPVKRKPDDFKAIEIHYKDKLSALNASD